MEINLIKERDTRMPDKLIDSILSCSDLIVVLENRYGDQYIESYLLPNILYSKGQFWGKFRNNHSSDTHIGINNLNSISYAYNNFSNIVSTSCLHDRLERYYSAHSYSSVNFHTRGNYSKIWSNIENNNITLISKAVKEGARLKVKLEDNDGYTYILPAHTVEVFEKDNNFTLETEYDGYPERLRHFQAIEKLSSYMDSELVNYSAPNYPATNFEETIMFLTSYIIKKNGFILKRSISNTLSIDREELQYNNVEIWVENN
ncbi:MAG: hypothetical protein ACI892_000447 [Marinobacter maritimus]|jgi:hypothetical protein